MEAMIEFVMELVLDIVIGGALEFVKDEHIPKGIRIGLLIFLSIFYIAFLVVLAVISIESNSILFQGIILLLAILFSFLFITLWIRVIKWRRK